MQIRKSDRPKYVPQRTCIACRQVRPKRDLVRIVRDADNKVGVDPAGKMSGRGMYLCNTQSCWEKGLKRNRLEYALKTQIAPEDRQALLEYSKVLPE